MTRSRRPRAAPARWPYMDHRTIAEIEAWRYVGRERRNARIAELDETSHQRALTDEESLELERLLRREAA